MGSMSRFAFLHFLLCGLALAAAAPAAASEAACALFLERLPGISASQCEATRLEPSGARSRLGTALYWREILPQRPGIDPLRVLVVGAMHVMS